MGSKCKDQDRAMAEALRLAKDYIEKKGFRYGLKDIGAAAREIMDAVQEKQND